MTELQLQRYGLAKTANGLIYGMWAVPRPLTRTWGSGQVWRRIVEAFGSPDVAFGKTDRIPDEITSVDRKNGFEWANLPFTDNQHLFGYWDPPYDKLYRPECREIWRCCKRLAILHPMVYPTSWMSGARRTGMVAITMGPLKAIRCLQIFEKRGQQMELASYHA